MHLFQASPMWVVDMLTCLFISCQELLDAFLSLFSLPYASCLSSLLLSPSLFLLSPHSLFSPPALSFSSFSTFAPLCYISPLLHHPSLSHTHTHNSRVNVNSVTGPHNLKGSFFHKEVSTNIFKQSCASSFYLPPCFQSYSLGYSMTPPKTWNCCIWGSIYYFRHGPSTTPGPVWWWGWKQITAMPSLIQYEQLQFNK